MVRATKKPAALAAPTPAAVMSLADIGQAGGFISAQPVKRTVTWNRSNLGKDTIDLDIWVRQMNAEDFEALMSLPKGEGRMAATVARLASFGDSGTEKLKPEQAARLDPFLLLAITEAINEATPAGKA